MRKESKSHLMWFVIVLWAIIVSVALSSCTPMRQASKPPANAEYVHMQIVLLNHNSYDFFKQGYRVGDTYWYLDNNKTYPLPKNWSVWEARVIKR